MSQKESHSKGPQHGYGQSEARVLSRRDFVKRTAAVAGIAAVASSGLTAFASLSAEEAAGVNIPQDPERLADALQAIADNLAARDDLHHAVLAVETGDGAFHWSGAAGEASPDGEPMRTDTPYFITSVDKIYAATAIMRLHEQGRLDLEAPITEYLPSSLTSRIHVMDGVDRSSAITTRHLLSHTSGLADYLEDRPEGGRSLIEKVVESGDIDWDVEQAMGVVREDLRPHFVPQSVDARKPKVRYCDTNYALLITMIETLAAKTLDKVLTELLFDPFNIRHTYIEGLSAPADPTPNAATLWFGEQPMDLPKFFMHMRSVYSTVDDQIKSLRAILGGHVFEDPATLRSMRQWNALPFPMDASAARAPGWPIEYGYGLMRFQMPPILTGMYRLPAVIGHTGSTGTWLFYCPEMDAYFAGVVDQGTAGAVPYRTMPKLLRIMLDASR